MSQYFVGAINHTGHEMAGSVIINMWTIFACEPQVSNLGKNRVKALKKK
jgi:hypothetical protein